MTATQTNQPRGWSGALMGAAIPLALCGVLMGPSAAQAAPFPPAGADLYDTFTVGDGTGTAGAAITGTALEGGSATWSDKGQGENWKFNAAGEAFVDATSASGGLAVNLPDVENKIVTVQADLDPDGNVQFLGIALANKNFYNRSVFFRLYSNGNWGVTINEDSGGGAPRFEIADGSITRSGGFDTLVLQYNVGANTLSATINNTSVLSNFDLSVYNTEWIDGTTGNIKRATIYYAGANTDTTAARADNFAASVTPIPEPGSLSLLTLGGLVMLRRRRSAA